MMRAATWAALLLAAMEAGAACPVPDATASAAFRAFRDTLTTPEARVPLIDCLKREIEQAGSTEPLHAARLRLAAATLLQASAESQAARALLEPAIPLFESARNPDALAVAERELGVIEDDLGEYESAEKHLQRALALFTRDDVPRHVEVGHTLHMLGTVASDRGRYDEAEQMFSRALVAADAADDNALRARVHGGAANLAYFRNHYRKAIREYEAALNLLIGLHGERSLPVARTYNNLGGSYFYLGMYDEAQRWHDRSLALKLQLFGPDSPTVASTLSNLAEVLAVRGEIDKARKSYERARDIFARAQGEQSPFVPAVETALAELELKSGNAQRARALLEHAAAAREQALGPDAGDVAWSLIPLGSAHQALGRVDDARSALERAVFIAHTVGEAELRAASDLAYARFMAGQQRFAGAVLFGKLAVNVLQTMRDDVSKLGYPVERSFLAAREPAYRALADWLITHGRLPEASQVLDMLKEEEYADFMRTRALTEDFGATRAQLTRQEAVLSDRLSAAAEAFKQGSSAASRAEFAALLRRISGDFGNESPAVALQDASTVPAAEKAMLAEGTALVRYVVLTDRLRIVVTTATRQWQRDSAIPEATLNRQVFQLREALQNRRSDPRARALELYRELIAPVEADLLAERIRRLLIVEDGTLRYLPFAALFDGERWLIESWELQVVTPAARVRETSARVLDRVAAFGVTKGAPGLAPLRGVATELDWIVKADDSDRYGVLPGFVALDGAFSANRLQVALAEGYPAIHIATHFVFRPGPVDDSYLLLGNGAQLTLAELRSPRYPLHNVELLTLSACETAVGQPDATGREFESFGVLAQRQGAGTVLATLWPVNDLSTTTLMARFYRGRQNGGRRADTAGALREVQLSFLQKSAATGGGIWSHPFYWAPYVVMSGWAPASSKR
jgi:CHAT domain-containing protein/Tfp pilus assembly protein PilF